VSSLAVFPLFQGSFPVLSGSMPHATLFFADSDIFRLVSSDIMLISICSPFVAAICDKNVFNV